MKSRRGLVFTLIFIACLHISAQEWRIGLDQTSESFQLVSNKATYLKLGVGPSFADEYYALLPDHETRFYWYAGAELLASPVQASRMLEAATAYTNLRVNQVLFGDRYRDKWALSLAAGNISRWVFPSVAESYFLHRPELILSLEAADDPFWSVLQAHATLSGAFELGHSASAGFWAFPAAEAAIDIKLPVIGEYFYVDLYGDGASAFPPVTAGIIRVEERYTRYSSPLRFNGAVEVRSRFLKFEPGPRMALELAAFGTAAGTAASMDFSGLAGPDYAVGAFLEWAVEHYSTLAFRMRIGASYDPRSGKSAFLFAVK